jgi:hypothetical protein
MWFHHRSVDQAYAEPWKYSEEPDNKLDLKVLDLPPTFIHNSCVCGHGIEFRDKLYDHKNPHYDRYQNNYHHNGRYHDHRKQQRFAQYLGVTIKPKIPPVPLSLKD